MNISAEEIDALLPQTQCGLCGHGGCLPYAKAIIEGENINRCPPGGAVTLQALHELTQKPVLPLIDAQFSQTHKKIALIKEDECIGCTLCLNACPTDAIIGSNKTLHVVVPDLCTGCELCLPPCPVDCIEFIDHPTQAQTWSLGNDEAMARANIARERFMHHNNRLKEREAQKKKQNLNYQDKNSLKNTLNDLLGED